MKALVPACAALVVASALAALVSITPAEGGFRKQQGADQQEGMEFGEIEKVDAQGYTVDISRERFADTKGMIARLYVRLPNATVDLVFFEGGWKHQRARLAGQSKRFAAQLKPGMKIYFEHAPFVPETALMTFTDRGGLEWMKGDPAYLPWKDAMSYCEEHGARLPTIREWTETYGKLEPAEWGQIFFGAIHECLYTPCYWSSTEHVEGRYDSAYYFYEERGTQYMLKTYSALTRCVVKFIPGRQ
jgi:hypothetical protein